MAAKKFLEKLRDEWAARADSAAANEESTTFSVDEFCKFADSWLAENPPIGVGYEVEGLMLRFANGDNFLLSGAAGYSAFNDSVAIVGPEKLNARAAPDKTSDFHITGR